MTQPTNPEQHTQSPFEIDEQITAMKEDVANRTHGLRVKQMLVSGGMFVLGGAIFAGAMFFGGGMVGAPIGQLLLAGGAIAGGAVSNIMFAKEIKKLEMDEQFLEARLQGEVGNRYWQHYNQHSQGQNHSFDPGLQGAPPPVPGQSHGI